MFTGVLRDWFYMRGITGQAGLLRDRGFHFKIWSKSNIFFAKKCRVIYHDCKPNHHYPKTGNLDLPIKDVPTKQTPERRTKN